MPIGQPFTVAEASFGRPEALALDVGVTSDGYAISWADYDKGWLKLVNPRRAAAHTPRLIFDKPPPGEGFTTSAATNLRAGTHAQAWTEGLADSEGAKIYIRVVPLRE